MSPAFERARAGASARAAQVTRPARSLLVGALALAGLFAASTAEAGRLVIPPGEEALAMRILGGALPAECRLLGASITRTNVEARYACAGAEGGVTLVHPSEAPGATVRSADLALVAPADSPLPAALFATVGERLRAEEGSWRWLVEGRSVGRSLEQAGLSSRARRLVAPLVAAAGAGFLAAFALAIVVVRRLPRAPGEPAPPSRRWQLGLATAAVAIAFTLLASKYPRAPVHPDTTRDLFMAAECVVGQPCDHGPPTTLGVLVQGALWTRALAASHALGLGPRALELAVALGLALSSAVVLLATRRRFGPGLAVATAALYVPTAAFLVELPLLWNPSLAPLPLAVFHALLVALACADDERPWPSLARVAGAALALALAIDCHVAFVVLVPVLLAAVVGCARRPLASSLTGAAVLVTTLLVDSRTAWVVNGHALADAGAAVPLVVALGVVTLAAVSARRWLHALPPRARAAVFVVVATAYVGGAAATLFALFGSAAGVRYLLPAAPGLALGAAWLARAVARRLRRPAWSVEALAVVASVVSLRAARPLDSTAWTYADVEAVAPAVFRRVPTDGAVRARVRGAADVVAALPLFAPRGAGSGVGAGDDLLMLLSPKPLAPPLGPALTVVDLGSRAAVLASVPPFLDRTRMTFCFAPRSGTAADAGCAEAHPVGDGQVETAEERAYPAFAAVRDAFPAGLLRTFGALHETIAIPAHATPGPAHLLALLDAASGWRIEKVGGVRARGVLPATHVVIEGGTGDGEVVLARDEDAVAPKPERYRLPALAEAPEDVPALVELLQARATH